ncbi:MAG: hypothetical protein U1D55_08560 [Phycisphaerae bacterium]
MTRVRNLKALRWSLDLVFAAIVGFGLYLGAAFVLVGQYRIMPVGLARIVEVGSFLHAQEGQARQSNAERRVFLLGSSVLLEGVDCELLDRAANSNVVDLTPKTGDATARGVDETVLTRSFNLAWTGATFRQWLLVLPAIRKASPATLVLCVDLPNLASAEPIPAQRLNLAAWWDFVPRDELAELIEQNALNSDEAATLRGSRLSQILAFRSLPLGAIDSQMREVARKDLRYAGYVENFRAPWIRRGKVPPEALARNIEEFRAGIAGADRAVRDAAMKSLRAVIQRARRGGAPVFVALTPVHPELARRLGDSLLDEIRGGIAALCQDSGAAYFDDSRFLNADEFSDAVHPFEDGRARWSAELGRRLGRPIGGTARRAGSAYHALERCGRPAISVFNSLFATRYSPLRD